MFSWGLTHLQLGGVPSCVVEQKSSCDPKDGFRWRRPYYMTIRSVFDYVTMGKQKNVAGYNIDTFHSNWIYIYIIIYIYTVYIYICRFFHFCAEVSDLSMDWLVFLLAFSSHFFHIFWVLITKKLPGRRSRELPGSFGGAADITRFRKTLIFPNKSRKVASATWVLRASAQA